MSAAARRGPTRRALLALPLLGGCADLGYRARALNAHLALAAQAQPIAQLLQDPATPEPTRRMLRRAQALRRFASEHLALPDNNSYTRYVQLPGASVVWNVVATPRFSLQLKTWCQPVMGCTGYRGHPEPARAEAEGAALRAEGWDVHVYGVPAYSTLGWSRLIGGDPLLSSFAAWGLPELARLLFHELAHQQVYVADDSGFNESYATAVEQLGLEAWWAAHPDPAEQARDALQRERRAQWQARALALRGELQTLYASDRPDKAEAKAMAFSRLHHELEALAQRDAGYAPYAAWARGANNAHLALLSTYQLQVPAFRALFAQEGGDWRRFHAAVAALAAQPRSDRKL